MRLLRYADSLGAEVTTEFFFLLLLCNILSTLSGGCSTYISAEYRVGVCIRNMNGKALPDFYVVVKRTAPVAYILNIYKSN